MQFTVYCNKSQFALDICDVHGCVKCKLALHGLAAYLLNGLQRSSNAAVYKADVNKRWRLLILTLRKIAK